jgi:hypothetical protein
MRAGEFMKNKIAIFLAACFLCTGVSESWSKEAEPSKKTVSKEEYEAFVENERRFSEDMKTRLEQGNNEYQAKLKILIDRAKAAYSAGKADEVKALDKQMLELREQRHREVAAEFEKIKNRKTGQPAAEKGTL